jgi:hypothetical protein
MYTLDPSVIAEIRRWFSVQDCEYVSHELATSPLPMDRSGPPPRIQIAVIWLSKGDLKRFNYELGGAQNDWRDALVAAGLANEDWRDVLRKHGVECSAW